MARDRVLIESDSEARTIAVGRVIGSVMEPGSVVVLEGELGSGKTRLTWGIAEALGVERSTVSSPTYALVHEYEVPGERRLIHADAYRMDAGDADDFETLLGIDGGETDWFAIIEWGSRIADLLPPYCVTATLSHRAESLRSIAVKGDKRFIQRLRAAMDGSMSDE